MRASRGSTISTPSDTREASAQRSAGNVLLVAAVVGVAIGGFSILADGILPGRLFTLLGNIATPWGLAAFVVGFRAASPRQGALAGALALVVGVVTYYAGSAVRASAVGELNVFWTVVALVAGPVIGACAAAISTRRDHPPLVAVVIPGAMFVAEGLFLLYDRKVWRTNFGAEPYRLIDVGVAAALIAGGFVLAWVFAKERRPPIMLGVAGLGVLGAFGFALLERIIATIV